MSPPGNTRSLHALVPIPNMNSRIGVYFSEGYLGHTGTPFPTSLNELRGVHIRRLPSFSYLTILETLIGQGGAPLVGLPPRMIEREAVWWV